MKKLLIGLISMGAALGFTATAYAGAGDDGRRAVRATVACGGNHLVRNGGNEIHLVNYVLRNYDPHNSITIDRIRIFDSHGVVLHDWPGGALPVFVNGVLGPGDNVLEPHQTAQLRSQDIFGLTGLPLAQRPITMKIDWSAHRPTLLMETSHVRLARTRNVTVDPMTGEQVISIGGERSRHQYDCRTIRTNRGHHH